MSVVARVQQLWIFPVKSMQGASVEAADVSQGGLRGDRSWAVVDDQTGATVTAAQEPRLRQVGTRIVDGKVLLDIPGAAPGLAPEAAAGALSEWLARPLRLAHRDGAGFVDVAPVHVVSTFSMSDAAHAEECDACDIRHPRANLVLELVPDGGAPERDWVGRSVALGSATLDVVRRPDHCLGVYADVAAAGQVRVGDEVSVTDD
ncbi:MAG: MOSC N-terminal beta barrel domain-containing protein [Actinomycetes bacterium]